MTIDPAIISALSAVLGSIVGGSASIATAWFNQRTQAHRETIRAEVHKRELLYAEFIGECTKLGIDALGHSLERAENMVKVYALHNRIRLASSDAVVEASSQAIKRIVELYYAPNKTKEELREMALAMKEHPLNAFSEACRAELARLQHA